MDLQAKTLARVRQLGRTSDAAKPLGYRVPQKTGGQKGSDFPAPA